MKIVSDVLNKIVYVIVALVLMFLFFSAIHYSYNLNLFWFAEDI